jgi:CRISPR/Cas system-associated exonuclease Cas4 (RecB family)
MAFTIKPFPEWSWSQSRDGIFRECHRKYYFHYYLSHNGWLRDSANEARIAYRLKQMSNLYLVLGDGIHQMAEAALKQWRDEKTIPSEEESAKKIRKHLNQAYIDSKHREEWAAAPKKRTMLHEIYYEGSLPEYRVAQIKERMDACVRQFFTSLSFRELQTSDDLQIQEIEELNTFYIAGEKIYVKLDFLYKRQDGMWVIVDWKTGLESEKNDQQLLLYALFLRDKYSVPYDKMEIRVEYLLSGECSAVQINMDDVERMKLEVIGSTKAMKQYLADETENRPLPANEFPASPHKRKCTGCSYREICDEKVLE